MQCDDLCHLSRIKAHAFEATIVPSLDTDSRLWQWIDSQCRNTKRHFHLEARSQGIIYWHPTFPVALTAPWGPKPNVHDLPSCQIGRICGAFISSSALSYMKLGRPWPWLGEAISPFPRPRTSRVGREEDRRGNRRAEVGPMGEQI